MSRRTVGVILISCAALLQAARYLAAAIYGSNMISWNADLYNALLEYTGNGLTVWSLVLLAVGIGYLIWAEVDEFSSRRLKQD